MLHAGFLLLCLRFLIAATGAVYPDVWPVLALIAGGLGLCAWRPQAALFAFIVAVPLLNGLGYVGLAELPSPVSMVFSGVFVGWVLRQIASRFAGHRSQVTGLKSYLEPATHDPRPRKAVLVTDVLISVVLLSLAFQIWRHHNSAGFWTVFSGQPGFGFGDPLYFITSAFVWLQGLFFFRMLIEMGEEQSAGGGTVAAWIKPAFVVFGISIAAFYLFQRRFDVPDSYETGRYCSPFEDVHSFGSAAVAVFAYAVASWRRQSWARTLIHGMGVAALLALVAASWSRAAWLAGTLVLLLVAWNRLPRRWSITVVALGVAAIALINLNARRESWQHNGYLVRLISLARVENPANKSPDRFNLYHKAVGMIREHPLVGHGIGSTYLTSVRFAQPGDPNADVPNFAHNFLLQMAAELGVPAAALFAALIAFALWSGCHAAGSLAEVPSSFAAASADKSSKSKVSRNQPPTTAAPQIGSSVPSAESLEKSTTIRSPVSGIRYRERETLGVTMALAAYLITQLTANSLNVYVSNQFFFWFLMAALLGAKTKAEVERSRSTVEV